MARASRGRVRGAPTGTSALGICRLDSAMSAYQLVRLRAVPQLLSELRAIYRAGTVPRIVPVTRQNGAFRANASQLADRGSRKQ